MSPDEWSRLEKVSKGNDAARELLLMVRERDLRVRLEQQEEAEFTKFETSHAAAKKAVAGMRSRFTALRPVMKFSSGDSRIKCTAKDLDADITKIEQQVAGNEKILARRREIKKQRESIEMKAGESELDRRLELCLMLIRSMSAGLTGRRA